MHYVTKSFFSQKLEEPYDAASRAGLSLFFSARAKPELFFSRAEPGTCDFCFEPIPAEYLEIQPIC